MDYYIIVNKIGCIFGVIAHDEVEARLTALEVIKKDYIYFGEIEQILRIRMYHKNFIRREDITK